MDTLDPGALANWTSGVWKNGIPSSIGGISNDTRQLGSGQLFVALRTSLRDGHDFLEAALKAGAAGAIVDRYRPEVALPQLLVRDVAAALIAGAHGYRLSWQATVVGITGSCGKTTCKEVLACLLSGSRTLSTSGNLNNLIGVPLSVLRPEGSKAEYAVLEAGISEPGEMQQLERAIAPDWGIVTAIGPAHLQDLGSIENIAREKGNLLHGKGLRGAFLGETAGAYLDEIACPQAVLVKRDSELLKEWSYDFKAQLGSTLFRQRIAGTVQTFEYSGTGAGLASNVALAVATAYSLGTSVASISERLKRWAPAQMRNEWRRLGSGLVFLDCYNANPVSMRDSLATFVAEAPESQARFYVMGCMEELGSEAVRFHYELGREIPLRKQDFLLVIGGEASSVLRGMKDAGCDTGNCFEIDSIGQAKAQLAQFSGSVFLKGSRRYGLESVLGSLEGGRAC